MSTPKSIFLGIMVAVGLFAGWFALQTQPVESGAEAAPALRARLLDESGAPLECRATLWRTGDGQRQIWPGAGGVCVEGWLSWETLEPGGYRLMAQVPGRVLVDRDLEVGLAPIDLGLLSPGVGGVLRGVVQLDGEPVRGAVLALEGGRRHGESGPDGTFAFPGVVPGPIEVRAALGAQGAIAHVDVGVKEPAEVLLELEELPERGVVGLRFEMDDAGARIRQVHPQGPARDSLRVGDVIEQIGGTDVVGLSRQDVLHLLAGEPGQLLTLSVRREGRVEVTDLVRVPHGSL